MRPLFHPAIEDISVEGILHALTDPVRVAIYAALLRAKSPLNCTNYAAICDKRIPKSTLSQHFKILREAGLITCERNGVEMQNHSREAELELRFPGLVRNIIAAYEKQAAES
jgi:DNA-binding transcriptional ArsR family regulator